jgi:hypothetical protein
MLFCTVLRRRTPVINGKELSPTIIRKDAEYCNELQEKAHMKRSRWGGGGKGFCPHTEYPVNKRGKQIQFVASSSSRARRLCVVT